MTIGLRLICSEVYQLFLPALAKNFILISLPIILGYCSFQTLAHGWIHYPLRSSLHQKMNCHFWEFIFIISDDLWGQWKPIILTFSCLHCSPFQLFLYHVRECLIILMLCLWTSYYSRIMLAKLVTYNSQNYAGILGAGLIMTEQSWFTCQHL